MRVGIISDIHSNLEALLAVEKDIVANRVDCVFCLGDVVGYGANPLECLNLITEEIKVDGFVKGNHEEYLLRFMDNNLEIKEDMSDLAIIGVEYTKENLSLAAVDKIRSLPLNYVLEEFGLILTHSSCRKDHLWEYIEEEDQVKEELKSLGSKICVLGHTHVPFVYGESSGLFEILPDKMVLSSSEKFVINVGSVGQPRDGDCRASYGIFNFDKDKVTFTLRKVFYNIAETEEKIKKAGLPTILSERLFQGM